MLIRSCPEKEVHMVGEIAGLIAAIVFAILAGFMIFPLIRLGRLFDKIADSVKEAVDHTIPALDEGVTTVKEVNKTLADVNEISGSVSDTAQNISALADLYSSMLGKPIVKVASSLYAVKKTATSFVKGKKAKDAKDVKVAEDAAAAED
jgi:uncharacterized protein YoxC